MERPCGRIFLISLLAVFIVIFIHFFNFVATMLQLASPKISSVLNSRYLLKLPFIIIRKVTVKLVNSASPFKFGQSFQIPPGQIPTTILSLER